MKDREKPTDFAMLYLMKPNVAQWKLEWLEVASLGFALLPMGPVTKHSQ